MGQLGKSRSALGRHLQELVAQGVCRLETAPNQHRDSWLQVRAAYWPFERARTGPPEEGESAYVARVRRLFQRPSCVQGAFAATDEKLAARWYGEGLPLETVRRAILLGCTRKSMTLIDRPDGQPIRSLTYFEPVLAEVRQEAFPSSYWQHVESTLERCEQHWRAGTVTPPRRARPDLEQAAAARGTHSEASNSKGDTKGETR